MEPSSGRDWQPPPIPTGEAERQRADNTAPPPSPKRDGGVGGWGQLQSYYSTAALINQQWLISSKPEKCLSERDGRNLSNLDQSVGSEPSTPPPHADIQLIWPSTGCCGGLVGFK